MPAMRGVLLSGSDDASAIAGTVLIGVGIPVFFAGIYRLLERLDGAASERERACDPLLIRF